MQTSEDNESNKNFLYLVQFNFYLYPNFRNYEMSVRTANWSVFKADTDGSIDIFFAAGRPNYSLSAYTVRLRGRI